MYILLSNSCLVLPAVVKQQQEEIYRNHIPSLFAVSVQSVFSGLSQSFVMFFNVSCEGLPGQ